MKNICFLCGDITRGGGTEKVTEILSRELSKKHNVFVLSLNKGNEKLFFNFSSAVHLNFINEGVFKNKYLQIIQQAYLINSYCRENQISTLINVDVVLFAYSFLTKLLNQKLNLISWEQFCIKNDLGFKKSLFLRKIALRYSDYYVCLTKSDVLEIKKNMKVKSNLISIYNPFLFSGKVDYDNRKKIIVTVGNFFSVKGFDLAVLAAEKVFARNPEWKWYFCGDGLEFEKIRMLIREKKLENKIVLTGRLKNVSDILNTASIYVMTSRSEGFGMVLLEAKAASLPVIAFDVPYGPREIINDKINGYLIKPFEINVMAEAINNLIEDKELRYEFANQSCSNMQQFDISETIKKWNEIIK